LAITEYNSIIILGERDWAPKGHD